MDLKITKTVARQGLKSWKYYLLLKKCFLLVLYMVVISARGPFCHLCVATGGFKVAAWLSRRCTNDTHSPSSSSSSYYYYWERERERERERDRERERETMFFYSDTVNLPQKYMHGTRSIFSRSMELWTACVEPKDHMSTNLTHKSIYVLIPFAYFHLFAQQDTISMNKPYGN